MLDVRQRLTGEPTARKCRLWCWVAADRPVEWERRTLVVGGTSPIGLIAAAATGAFSVLGNRRRRRVALEVPRPGWRYVASGAGSVVDGRLVVGDESGLVRSFDLVDAQRLDSPSPGWLRVTWSGSSMQWAIQVM